MNSVDIQILSAYMDSELTSFEKETVEQRLSDDPAFWTLLQKLRQQDLCLRDAVREIEKTPLPPALENLLHAPANDDSAPGKISNVITFLKSPRNRAKLFSSLRFPAAAALVLVAVLMVNRTVDHGMEMPPTTTHFDQVPIHISQALSSIVAGTTLHMEHGAVTEILAFVRKDGALCKHYIETNKSVSYEAVSCYEEGNWINPVIATAVLPSPPANQYTPADGGVSPVNTYIEQTIDGTSLTVEQERELMDQKLK